VAALSSWLRTSPLPLLQRLQLGQRLAERLGVAAGFIHSLMVGLSMQLQRLRGLRQQGAGFDLPLL